MSRDPWKRAYNLKKLNRAPEKKGRISTPAIRGRRRIWPVVLLVLLVLIAGGAYAAWHYRSLWIPRYRDKLPEVVADVVKEPRVYVDYTALEQGLGVHLSILGDYLDLIASTRDGEPAWDVKQTGGGTLRLESDGIKVYVQDGAIQTYKIDMRALFESERWQDWLPAWRDAGLSPDLTWTAFTGEEEMPMGATEYLYVCDDGINTAGGWRHPAFNLEFHGGWLRRIEGRYEFGPTETNTEADG